MSGYGDIVTVAACRSMAEATGHPIIVSQGLNTFNIRRLIIRLTDH